MRIPVRHYLYRCYDAEGRLLYIGCTSQVAYRMQAHRKDPRAKASRWLQVSMERYEVSGPYPTQAAGLYAEAAAILAEQPLFNSHGRGVPGWMIRADVAEYLFAHGRGDLALKTTCLCVPEDDVVCRAHTLAEHEALSRTG